jgi:hypothetical protein
MKIRQRSSPTRLQQPSTGILENFWEKKGLTAWSQFCTATV